MYDDKKEIEQALIKPSQDDLVGKISEIIRRSRPSPGLSQNPLEAANQVLKLFEKEKQDEKISLTTILSKNNSERKIYVWPFADRIKYLLLKFLGIDHKHQTLILSAREDNIFWRGEELDCFVSMINEIEKSRKMPKDSYIKKSLRSMRRYVKNKTIDSNAAQQPDH